MKALMLGLEREKNRTKKVISEKIRMPPLGLKRGPLVLENYA